MGARSEHNEHWLMIPTVSSPRRRSLVQARVSARELASWRAKAAAGVSSSALLRQAMARTGVWTPTAADVEREVERARTRELARIGNNLNRIARWANEHKSAADAVEVSRHLAAIELALRNLIPPPGPGGPDAPQVPGTLIPLAKACEQALANRMLARSGGDPLSEKRRVQGVPTFAEAAQRVLEQKRGGWRGRWHAQNWWRSMERYVFPRVGNRPVSEVNTADVLEILTPIWHVKAETTRAVRQHIRQRIRSVLEWAIAMDLRNDNPCDRVLPMLGPQNDM